MELIIIRHGEPDYSHLTYQDNCILPTEAGLTEKGKLQAKEASFNDLLYGAELIICSPFERALETATIINKELNLPLIIEKDLHEWVPDMTYKSKIKELKSLYYDYKQKEGRKVSGDEVWESDKKF